MPGRSKRGPKKRRRVRPKLHFICDNHVGREFRTAISAVPGYSASPLAAYGLAPNSSDGLIMDRASPHRMVFLTCDNDTVNVDYPRKLCTHEGVLKMRPDTPITEDFIPNLVRFLRTTYYKLCRHAFVELHPTRALVWQLTSATSRTMKIVEY